MEKVIQKLKMLKDSCERQSKMTPITDWPGTEKEHKEYYEAWAKEYGKAINILRASQNESNKDGALPIQHVSNRRELLYAFQKDYNRRNFDDCQICDQDIELFLKQ